MSSISYKETRPEYRSSVGSEAFGIRKFKIFGKEITFWEVTGAVDKIWSEDNGLSCRIQEILVEEKRQLTPTKSKKSSIFPRYALSCYMVGPDKDHATPHAAIHCSCKYLGRKAREAVLGHGVLQRIGWGTAFLHLPIEVLHLMEEYNNILFREQEGSFEPRGGNDSRCVSCTSLQLPPSPTGVGITTQGRDCQSSTATLGGLLRIDNEMYGITVAHIFGETRCHCITKEEDAIIDPLELDFYEGAAPVPASIASGVSSSGHQQIGFPHYLPHEDDSYTDYALLNVRPEIGWTVNSVMSVDSTGSWRFHYPSRVAASMPQGREDVLVPARYGPLKGKSIQSVSILSMGEPEAGCRVWKVSLDDIEQGQCGSWVLNAEGDQVLGILIAACPSISEAYVLPMRDIILDIVSKGLGIDVSFPETPISRLHQSLITGHLPSMEAALEHNLEKDVTFCAEYRSSKVYQAAEVGNATGVNQCIKRGDDLRQGRLFLTVSPVYESVRLQRTDSTKLLVSAGFDVDQGIVIEKHSALYAAIVHGYIGIAVALIEARAPTSAICEVYTVPPLLEATDTTLSDLQVVELLLESGANVNQCNTYECMSAADLEMQHPNEELRLAIERAEESAKTTTEEKPPAEETGDEEQGDSQRVPDEAKRTV